jgi:hypothetical protein
MNSTEPLADLRYIRAALGDSSPSPVIIPLAWAGLLGVGLALVDIFPAAIPFYWTVAGVGGMLWSLWIGRRQAIAQGDLDEVIGMRWASHFFGLLITIALVVGLSTTGWIPESALNPTIVSLVMLAYFLAGVHLDRSLLFVAAGLAAAAVCGALMPTFGWSTGGVVVAIVAVTTAIVSRRRVG